MSLDELKSAWNTGDTKGVRIPSQTKQLGAAKHLLEKLKRGMKNEWYIQAIGILFLAFFPQLFHIDPAYDIIYYASYTFLVVISAYYFNLFRHFYIKINHYRPETKESLSEIYNEFKLNIERYHAFSFLLLPTAMIAIGLYFNSRLMEKGKDFLTLSNGAKYTVIALTIVVCTCFILAILAWTRYYYGPYVRQLKQILDEIKKEELKENNDKATARDKNSSDEDLLKNGE